MQLLIKQRVFSWTDSFDVYDSDRNRKYFVKGEFFSLTHKLHVYDNTQKEIGVITQRLFSLLPVFDIELNGKMVGTIKKKFTFFRPQYEVDMNGWRVEGDFLQWNYDVYGGCSPVMRISKKLLNWGDTYVIDFADPQDEIIGLLLVLAIDVANCTDDNKN